MDVILAIQAAKTAVIKSPIAKAAIRAIPIKEEDAKTALLDTIIIAETTVHNAPRLVQHARVLRRAVEPVPRDITKRIRLAPGMSVIRVPLLAGT